MSAFNVSFADDLGAVAGVARLAELEDWLRRSLPDRSLGVAAASVDASFRRYYRATGEGGPWIVMDAPPEHENCRPFVAVAGRLREAGLNAPEIVAADVDAGFLLLTDFGDETYLRRLEAGGDPQPLYQDAIDALLSMQRHAESDGLPDYDETLLTTELDLFPYWLLERHLRFSLTDAEAAEYRKLSQLLIDNACAQPRVFVHRDYHSRNLMCVAENGPGILDFQDAVCGPLLYDLVSLLRDCYVRWPATQVDCWLGVYVDGANSAGLPMPPAAALRRQFDLMGVQRHLKAAGIFARLAHRDGKRGFLDSIPLTLSYVVDVAEGYRELAALHTLLTERVLPALGGEPICAQ